MKPAGMVIVIMISMVYAKPENSNTPAKWMKWEEVNGRIIKNQKSGTVGSLHSYLCTIFPNFFIHSFLKRKQAKSYEEDKQKALMKNSNTVMVQVDFAENYTCAAQDDIQSANWKQNQITLFTSVLWFRENTQFEVIIRDHLKDYKTPIVVLWMSYFQRNQLGQPQLRCSLMALAISSKINMLWVYWINFLGSTMFA